MSEVILRNITWTFANLHASDATRASDLEGPLVEGLCLSVGTDKCGTGETLLRTRDAGFAGSSESGGTLGMLLYTAAAFNSIFKGSNCVLRLNGYTYSRPERYIHIVYIF